MICHDFLFVLHCTYKKIFYIHNLSACLETYFCEWAMCDDLFGNFMFHEDAMSKQYAKDIKRLKKGQRLCVEANSMRAFVGIDTTPVSNLSSDKAKASVTNLVFVLADCFEYGCQLRA